MTKNWKGRQRVSEPDQEAKSGASRRGPIYRALRQLPLAHHMAAARQGYLDSRSRALVPTPPDHVTEAFQAGYVTSAHGLTPRAVKRANLRCAVNILVEASVPHFAVPDENGRYAMLGVADDDWSDFVRAVEAADVQPPLYVGVETVDPSGDITRVETPLTSDIGRKALRSQRAVHLFQFHKDIDTSQHFGLLDGCRVERWVPDSSGALEAPSRNLRTSNFEMEIQNKDRVTVLETEIDSLSAFTANNIFESSEPIDIVYLWVDGQDEEWRVKRDQTIEALTGTAPADSVDPSRFRDNGELRYSLRSILQYCDWVRNIYLVTDSQIPTWLDPDHPRIHMVSHQELFGGEGKLPTYNSHAIASRIHHIEGLSEQYIITNDDVFFGQDVGQRHFFLSNGTSKFFLSRATLPDRAQYSLTHEAARSNSAQLLERDFGVKVSRAFYHTPLPQIRSLMFELEERYPEAFEITRSNQLRSHHDFEVNAWLHHYYGYLMRRCTPGAISYTYFDLSDQRLVPRLNDLLRNHDSAVFCLNDSPGASDENLQFVHDWLERFYPRPAPWELDAR